MGEQKLPPRVDAKVGGVSVVRLAYNRSSVRASQYWAVCSNINLGVLTPF